MSPTSDSGTPRRTQPSKLERVLSIFGEVKPGEGGTILLLFANIFLLLTAYYILKVVREALTLSGVEIFGIKMDCACAELLDIITPFSGEPNTNRKSLPAVDDRSYVLSADATLDEILYVTDIQPIAGN